MVALIMSKTELFLSDITKIAASIFKQSLFWNFYLSSVPDPKIDSAVPQNEAVQNQTIMDLENSGIRVVNLKIDVDIYRSYMNEA